MHWLLHSTSAGGWATLTPHLTGGKTKYHLSRFLCSLTCKNQLWDYTQNITTMLGMWSKSSPWWSKKQIRQVKYYFKCILTYLCTLLVRTRSSSSVDYESILIETHHHDWLWCCHAVLWLRPWLIRYNFVNIRAPQLILAFYLIKQM